jgi:hypothetical protein
MEFTNASKVYRKSGETQQSLSRIHHRTLRALKAQLPPQAGAGRQAILSGVWLRFAFIRVLYTEG